MQNLSTIRDYTIKEKLGSGAYGVVYKTTKKAHKTIYVMKQINLTGLNKSEIEDVKNEAKILSSLNSAYVVKHYESFIEKSLLCIVMEYCENGDLSKYLQRSKLKKKHLEEKTIWSFFIQICLGLAFIHGKKILHRDLKSLNIFLATKDKVRIGDLGVAKSLNHTLFANTFVGTPYYLSPEMCEEKPYICYLDIMRNLIYGLSVASSMKWQLIVIHLMQQIKVL